jgi:hypothetical protein
MRTATTSIETAVEWASVASVLQPWPVENTWARADSSPARHHALAVGDQGLGQCWPIPFQPSAPRAGPATGGPLRASGGNRPGPCLPNRPPPSASPVRRPPARRRRRSSPIAVRIESDNTATTPCLLTSSTPSGRRGGHRFELDRTFLGRSAAVVRGQDARQSEATPNPQWPAARQSVRPGASPTPPGPPWHQ